jgi:hypothetical protein
MAVTGSKHERIAPDENADHDDDTDPMVTHSQEIVDDADATELSGIPFWAVDAETERISLPLPPDALPTPGVTTVRSGDADAEERAVRLFDHGIALRAQHRDSEALEAWEKALELVPADPIYKESVRRLRAQLHS